VFPIKVGVWDVLRPVETVRLFAALPRTSSSANAPRTSPNAVTSVFLSRHNSKAPVDIVIRSTPCRTHTVKQWYCVYGIDQVENSTTEIIYKKIVLFIRIRILLHILFCIITGKRKNNVVRFKYTTRKLVCNGVPLK
jgi:hypothetical protein